jgi:hypothetical protein
MPLGMIVCGIPFLIQIALFLFAVGLVILILGEQFWDRDQSSCIDYPCHGSLCLLHPVALVFVRLSIPDDDVGFHPWHSHKFSVLTKGLPILRKPLSQQWKGLIEFLREAHRKPEQLEIEAVILAWLLTNSTTDEALEEPVKAVAGSNSNEYIPDVLHKYGASSVLSQRLT